MPVHVDPNGRFVLQATDRAVELWIVERIGFDNRPDWQTVFDGPVACLHAALARLRPFADDVLGCVWSCADEQHRPDVENRLFTNVLPKYSGAPRGANAFAHLPARVRFERSFKVTPPPHRLVSNKVVYYRYELIPGSPHWLHWSALVDKPLATWHGVEVPLAALRSGNGWATWAAMRAARANVRSRPAGPPHTGDFALRLCISARESLQLVANMEWIIDGVIAAFQREQDHGRAEAVARLLEPRLQPLGLSDDLSIAQYAAPAIFAPPPFKLAPSGARCSLNPADDQLVAGYVALDLASPPRTGAELSGAIVEVDAA